MPLRPPTIFLLSPASLTGVRAKQLVSKRAGFEAAVKYRSPQGVRIDEAFSFMSALYFRGKVAYVRRFATPPPGAAGALVILPGAGLVPLDWRLDERRMSRLRRVPVDVRSRSYVRPLTRDARSVAGTIPAGGRVVLLGSVATGKYVDVLWPVFGERLLFPKIFAGLGDMSRGALMLRAAESGEELEYVPMTAERHRRG